MCSVVPGTALSPLCELYSVTENFPEAKESYAQSIVLLLLSTPSFLFIFNISQRLGAGQEGRVCCAW